MPTHKNLAYQAEEIARTYLEEALPQRWKHVKAVAHKTKELASRLFKEEQAQIVSAAAWLHDIGYAPEIKKTGFHPLDGALWLRTQGFDERIISLVAHHSCATLEAEVRRLGKALEEFPEDNSLLADALLFADMTTGPNGEDLSVQERVHEIVSRYGKDHVVGRFILKAEKPILEASKRIEMQLKKLTN